MTAPGVPGRPDQDSEPEIEAREQHEWECYEAARDAHRDAWYGPGGPGEFL